MDWIKVSIFTTSEGIEPLSGRLYQLGITGLEIEDEKDFKDFLENNKQYWDYVDDELIKEKEGETEVIAYVSDNAAGHEMLMAIRNTVAEMKQLVRFAASSDQQFLFETGTETVASLKHILDDIGEPNLGINFDPANLLIYGKDDPSVLVDQLADRIRVVHCKDANRAVNGDVFGKETVLGCGSANIPVLLKKLLEAGFCGPLIIERELPPGPEQEKDIAEAVKLIQSIAD